MRLQEILSRGSIIPRLAGRTKEEIIDELASTMVREYPDYDRNEIVTSLLNREKLSSTGIEAGVAIPHCKLKDLDRIILVFGRTLEGVDFQAHDGKPSHLFFALLAPDSSAGIHLKTLARLSRLLKEEKLRIALMEARTAEDMYNIILSEDEKLPC